MNRKVRKAYAEKSVTLVNLMLDRQEFEELKKRAEKYGETVGITVRVPSYIRRLIRIDLGKVK